MLHTLLMKVPASPYRCTLFSSDVAALAPLSLYGQRALVYRTLLSLVFFTLTAGGQLKLLCALRPVLCRRRPHAPLPMPCLRRVVRRMMMMTKSSPCATLAALLYLLIGVGMAHGEPAALTSHS